MTEPAPDGCVWVCPACGRTNADRQGDWDTSCMTWSVPCRKDSLIYENGRLVSAEAVGAVM